MGRLAGHRRPRRGAVRRRRHLDHPRHPHRAGPRRVLRGLLERHAVAAVPRRHRAAELPPRVVGHLREGEPALRRRGREGRRARRHGVGAGLPAAARAEDAARAAPGPHHRLLQPHPVPALRHLLAAAVAHADHRGAARRRRHRLPARGRRGQLRARGPPALRVHYPRIHRRRARARRHPAHRPRHQAVEARARAPHPPGRREALPDLDRRAQLRGDGQGPGHPGARPPDPRRPRRPEDDPAGRRPAGLHEGHRPPPEGVRRAPRRGTRLGRGRHARAGREPEPRAGGDVQAAARRDRAHGRADQRRLRVHQPHGHQLPAPRVPEGGDGGALPRGRRHARHRAPRRDEPGRQGVRGHQALQRGRARAQRVRGRRGRAEGRAPREPARHRGPQGGDPPRHRHAEGGAAQAEAGAPQARDRERRGGLVELVPRRPRAHARRLDPRGPRRRGRRAPHGEGW